jgi:uncharacterized protein
VIALLTSLVRIVVVLLIVRFVLRFVVSVIQGYQGQARPPRPETREVAATDMVRDRVCDTFLPRSRALVATVDGREQHFCSEACRDRARQLAAT